MSPLMRYRIFIALGCLAGVAATEVLQGQPVTPTFVFSVLAVLVLFLVCLDQVRCPKCGTPVRRTQTRLASWGKRRGECGTCGEDLTRRPTESGTGKAGL